MWYRVLFFVHYCPFSYMISMCCAGLDSYMIPIGISPLNYLLLAGIFSVPTNKPLRMTI